MSENAKKPANLRADVMPTDGYVLAVGGKLKTRYEDAKDAMTAAAKLKQSYPVIQVSPVTSPKEAVRAAIVAEQRAK